MEKNKYRIIEKTYLNGETKFIIEFNYTFDKDEIKSFDTFFYHDVKENWIILNSMRYDSYDDAIHYLNEYIKENTVIKETIHNVNL